jgi:hypothetical protein
MTAHVAEAGEARGRVVLQLASGQPSELAIEAAIRLAQAFQSEIESLFIEDSELIALASHPFAREVSLTGRRQRPLSVVDIEHDLKLAWSAVRRRVTELASAAEITVHHRMVRDEPVHALKEACEACGPWNVIALTEPIGSPYFPALERLFATITDATGVVVVGSQARRTAGRIVVALEDVAHAPGMLRAAERISPVTGGETELLLIAAEADRREWMEGELRLLLADRPEILIRQAALARGQSGLLAEALLHTSPGFVIAQFGGLAIPEDSELRRLTIALECPLLMVR